MLFSEESLIFHRAFIVKQLLIIYPSISVILNLLIKTAKHLTICLLKSTEQLPGPIPVKKDKGTQVVCEITMEGQNLSSCWRTVGKAKYRCQTSFIGGVSKDQDNQTKLIIGVDARPNWISGYCVNQVTHICAYYTCSSKRLPWKLRRDSSSDEFEMKNLMYALLLWEEEILAHKKVKMYTDNRAINTQDSVYGTVVTRFLEHLSGCMDVVRVNSNLHINKKKDMASFDKYIKPADDLTRDRLKEFQRAIIKTYGNISFMELHSGSEVNTAVEKWTTPCESCGFSFLMKS